MANKKKEDSKLQGISRLVIDATLGITDLVESMQQRIVHPPFLPATPIQHLITNISGIAFKNIRWTTKLIGSGIDKALGKFVALSSTMKTTEEREILQSVLNGVIGDYLEETKNPLSINMQFRLEGKTIPLDKKSITEAYPSIHRKIIVMVHGSCMNDLQWTRDAHNHGISLAKDLEQTPIYLQYNSGLHISTNGQKLNQLLDELLSNWPVPAQEIIILGHSMGGLVSRSAIHYGEQQKKPWTKHLKKVIFLGTPHHGAPLEKAGNYLDVILEAVPYAKPFARLGKIRSAGVTDLRYGNLLDADWQNSDRFKMQVDKRQHIPLPKKVACYSIAGVSGKENKSGLKQLLGDNLVGIKSALGQHKTPSKNLKFKKGNTYISYENNHLDLLSDSKVYAKIKSWIQ